ncbi:hypothetical protein ACH5RR_009483 [Cinchona calisaya]|uniref:GRF-type domain-containing protein n=1 Tax=Cinchona calisaya TaxID=153742 RepID=A0ABD3AEB7_9GENT
MGKSSGTKAPATGPSSSSSSSGSLMCRCGAGICHLRVSETDRNLGRRFYCCPTSNSKCRFFKWYDKVQAHELVQAPVCGCGAGSCRLDTQTTGPNSGRKCFVCPIKKGQGACNYIKWLDADVNAATGFHVDGSVISPRPTVTNCSDVSPAHSDLVEEIDESLSRNLGQEIGSLPVYTSQSPENLVPTSAPLKRDKIMWEKLKGLEDIMDETLGKHCKRLRHGDSKSDGSPFGDSKSDGSRFGSSSTCQTIPLRNSSDYLAELRDIWRQNFIEASVDFPSSYHPSSVQPMNSEVVRETSWIVAAIHQNLSFQIQGWWGRLAFPPSKCIIAPAPKPFFCCVFPSFDPISVPPKADLRNGRSSVTTLGSPLASKSCSQSILTLYERPQLLGSQESSIMRGLVSKEFLKAAEKLQNKLLSILSSLDIQDHEIMAREANDTFDALDQLRMDHKMFSEQVKEFIQSASLLDKINQSLKSDSSCRMLTDRCNDDKLKLDEINDAYARDVDAFSVSKQRAASLTEEVSHLKDKLFQTVAELSCCEAETAAMEVRMSELLKDKVKFEQCFRSRCEKLEDALKLHRQREAEQHAAKAAFEKAKVLLWGCLNL